MPGAHFDVQGAGDVGARAAVPLDAHQATGKSLACEMRHRGLLHRAVQGEADLTLHHVIRTV